MQGTFTWINGSDTGKIYTYDDISAAGAGASYRIVKPFTISTLLGDVPEPSVLGGASSAGAADNLLLFDSESNTYTTFYYKNSGVVGGIGWRSSFSASSDVRNLAIHPTDSGLLFVRRQTSDGQLIVSGEMKSGVTDILIRGGGGSGPSDETLNIVQALIPVNRLKLGSSGLFTGDSNSGLLGGASAGTADNLLVYNATTNTYTTYYYKNSGIVGGTGWRSSASASFDESETFLPSNSAILIRRKSNNSDFIWKLPSLD